MGIGKRTAQRYREFYHGDREARGSKWLQRELKARPYTDDLIGRLTDYFKQYMRNNGMTHPRDTTMDMYFKMAVDDYKIAQERIERIEENTAREAIRKARLAEGYGPWCA